MNQVKENLRKGTLIKNLPWGTRIRFPTKILKEVVMLMRGLCVLVVGSNTWIGVIQTDGCFGCVNTGHKMRYFPTHKGKEKEVNEAPHDCPYPNAPKRNRFYALRAKEASNKE